MENSTFLNQLKLKTLEQHYKYSISKDNMVSLNHICVVFQYVGAINFHRFSSVWKNKLQSVYVFLNAAVMSAFVLSHLLSTFTRAICYRPEFIQALVEDCLNILLMFGIFYFQLT